MSEVLDIIKDVHAELKEKAKTIPEDRFCEWYLGEFEKMDALEEKIMKQSTIMLKEIRNRKQSLQYVCGEKFQKRVDAAIDAGPKKDGKPKKKSLNFLTGTAGYRMGQETIRFTDEEKAGIWAINYLTFEQFVGVVRSVKRTEAVERFIKSYHDYAAIGSLNKTPFMDYIKETGEIPDGVELVDAVDNFYPQVEKLVLPEAEAQELLKGENDENRTTE